MSVPTRFTPEMTEAYLREGQWREQTTLDLLDAHAAARPNALAVVDPHTRLTWAEARAAVSGFAMHLDEFGLERDTPVVVQLHNTVESCLIRLALKEVGLIGAYAPIVWRRAELEAVIGSLQPGAFLVPERFRDADLLGLARELRHIAPELKIGVIGSAGDAGDDYIRITLDRTGPAAPPSRHKRFGPFEVTKLAVTSGSTGVPKQVERTEQQEIVWGQGAVERTQLVQDDIIACFAPLSGGPGYHAWAAWMVCGASFVVCEGFAPETIAPLIERERVSIIMTAPAILTRLVDWPELDDYDLGSLRVVRAGAASLPPAAVKEAERRLSCVVVKAGGAMEACAFGQISVEDPPEIRHGDSVGRVMPGSEIRIVDDAGNSVPDGEAGELWIRGPGTSSGYFRDPETTIKAWGTLGPEGWFRTGDLATMDALGYVTLVGRIKDMINRGGVSIYPLEIERALAEHPGILESALVPIPDTRLGEVPCLCIIPRHGAQVSLDEVIESLRAQEFASYKFPARLEIFLDFPRGQTMRVNRRRLADEVLTRHAPR